jgi:site-specific DNA recombinase
LLKCSKCGASMVSSTGKGGKYVYYTCRTYLKQSKSGCSGHRVSVQSFEKHVLNAIIDWVFSLENVKALVSKMRKIMADRRAPIKDLRHKLMDIEKRLNRYYEAFEQDTMNPADVADRVKALKVQKSEAEEELDQRMRNSELPASLYNPISIERIQQDFRDTLRSSSPQTIKRYLRILIEDIVLDGNKVTVRVKNEGILGFLEQNEPLSSGGVEPVLNSIYKWRPQGDLNPCRRRERAVS